MNLHRIRYLMLATAGMALFAIMGSAAAEESPPPASNALEEVVVTAQKREERLQDVPIAVSVVSGNVLADLNIIDTKELVRAVPSLVLGGSANGNFQQGWQVRGVGTQVNSATLPQSVSVVLDGMAMANAAMVRMDFADIDRIEVLKGPQGMLFGPNADAGLVNIVTNRPKLGAYEGSTGLSYGRASDFGDYVFQTMGNIPIGGDAALRLNGYYHERGGYITNVLNGASLNGYEDAGLKAKLLWNVTDDFTAYVITDFSKQRDPYRDLTYSQVVPGSPLANILTHYGAVAEVGNTTAVDYYPQTGHTYAGGAIVALDWKLGDYSLKSTSSYRNYTIQDFSKDLVNISLPQLFGTIAGPTKQFSQELQLTSPAGKTLDYVAGLYYNHVDIRSSSTFGGVGPVLNGVCPPFGPADAPCATVWNFSVGTNSVAAYAQATLHFTDRFRAFAGGRFTHDYNDFRFDNVVAPGYALPSIIFPLASGYYDTEQKSNFSWRAGAQYDLSSDLMAYATVSTGYKSPGFDSTSVGGRPGGSSASAEVFAETSTDYEVGLKSSWFNRRLVANLDAFYTQFKNFQTTAITLVPGANGAAPTPLQLTENAPRMRTQGFGADITAAPVDHVRLFANIAYTDAVFTDFSHAPCYTNQTAAGGCDPATNSTNANGHRLPNAPKWVGSVGASYDTALTDRLNSFVRANWYVRSGTNLAPGLDPLEQIPGYGLVGAALGVEDPSGRWKFTLSGKNLMNKKFCALATASGPFVTQPLGWGAVQQCYFSEEAFRTVYLTVDFRY